jgi:hypothetical protein
MLVFEVTIRIAGLRRIIKNLYLEGWSASDEQFERILIGALREAVNRIEPCYEPIVARLLSKKISQHCTINQYVINISSSL